MWWIWIPATLAQDSVQPDSARPDTAVPCSVTVQGTVPANSATGVPLDLVPQLLLEAYCSGLEAQLELRRADSGEVLATEQVAVSERGTLAAVTPSAPLDPNTTYAVEVFGEFSGITLITFTTGTGTLQPVTGAPALGPLTLTGDLDDSFGAWVRYEVDLTPAVDPQSAAVVRLVEDGAPDTPLGWAVVGAQAQVPMIGLWPGAEEGGTLCLVAVQTDGTGQEVGQSDPSCATLEDTGPKTICGCASAAAAPGWLGLLALGLVVRRRGA